MASSVEALAEAFEGTLRELRRLRRQLRRHLKGGFEGFLNGPSNSISQASPLRYLPEGPLTDCLSEAVSTILQPLTLSKVLHQPILPSAVPVAVDPMAHETNPALPSCKHP